MGVANLSARRLRSCCAWVHDKKVMSHAALGSDRRSQKS
jgi:hypothetical protein